MASLENVNEQMCEQPAQFERAVKMDQDILKDAVQVGLSSPFCPTTINLCDAGNQGRPCKSGRTPAKTCSPVRVAVVRKIIGYGSRHALRDREASRHRDPSLVSL